MPQKKAKPKNDLPLFLNEYFNVLVLVGMIFVFVFFYLFFLGPKFKLTTAAIQESAEGQKRLQAEQVRKLRDLKTVKRLYDEVLPASLTKFNGVLPNEYIQETLYGEFEEIITQQGFLLQTVTITSEKEDSGSTANMPTMGGEAAVGAIGEISVQLSVGAVDYSGFKQLLRTLENNSRLFDVTSVSFSEGANSAQIELSTYYYKIEQ